jgi:putative transposase
MTPEEREAVLAERQLYQRPWHGPPHYDGEGIFLITAACYEHRPTIGVHPARLAGFESDLLESAAVSQIYAWVVLPNHYHILIHSANIHASVQSLGQLHGRTSYRWNSEDHSRGRKVWHRAAETLMKSEGHFWATLNYVLHNPVRHGYVTHWQDWPFSSASEYLADTPREEAERRWREYPILDYGAEWDPPDL